ncbi:hypothetical protein [Natronobacterium gregoryi]|uniref:Uncharacterized protein n=2 Tax=Natronobacterium gregoryi TaxID=44930 RepID=L0AIN7_NATGS|nr:hypothetical protein [Natronobacterium gregoryi]AFZ73309.1 hypothetical protein Natgr_2128 [Natronobacterium gregoryi SP2]ELY73872.1 hypothetical protein C490_00890 [Natronobacterium gregoryi SP2]PLK19898.1 hypothetical protein CYV19_12365 [Natronobacterium gregoryi SP2]SFJ37667.1 hypothetical protein SAMN05443661_12525 [Natronobacterium gregoryi]
MSRRVDGVLAGVLLFGLLGAFVATAATLSLPLFFLGSVLTAVLEAVLALRAEAVGQWWAHSVVRGGSLVVALAVVVAGSVVAPSIVLSFALGATVTYLGLLGLVATGIVPTTTDRW